MVKFRVQWTASAQQDLLEIGQYIAADDLDQALLVVEKIEKRAKTLVQFPNRGRIVPELLAIGFSAYREVVVRPWRIIYRIDERRVYVIAVLDSRRELKDILLERLIR